MPTVKPLKFRQSSNFESTKQTNPTWEVFLSAYPNQYTL